MILAYATFSVLSRAKPSLVSMVCVPAPANSWKPATAMTTSSTPHSHGDFQNGCGPPELFPFWLPLESLDELRLNGLPLPRLPLPLGGIC